MDVREAKLGQCLIMGDGKQASYNLGEVDSNIGSQTFGDVTFSCFTEKKKENYT